MLGGVNKALKSTDFWICEPKFVADFDYITPNANTPGERQRRMLPDEAERQPGLRRTLLRRLLR